MTIRRSIYLGFALLAGAAANAGAADLGTFDGSLKDGPIMMGDAGMARYYLRGDLGYAWHRDPDMHEFIDGNRYDLSNGQIDETWTVGGGVGIYFSERFRADITYDRRFAADVDADQNTGIINSGGVTMGPGTRTFDVTSNVVLANFYYDLRMHRGIDPYVGFGLGWARNSTSNGSWTACGCTGTIEGADTDEFAWAIMAGVTVGLGGHGDMGSVKDGFSGGSRDNGWKLDVGYRYLDLGEARTGDLIGNNVPVGGDPVIEDLNAHEFRVGLRYDIW